ncbi:MAG: HAMP domain-containing sensor histidine kinase [Granulicella sp.]
MKPYSITRRVVALVLTVELIAAIGVTAFALGYERHAHFRSFDISLRGRADTIMGAVEDADTPKYGVMLDTTDLEMPRRDIYAVREEGGRELGKSSNWSPTDADWKGDAGFYTATIHGRNYRGIRVRGVRVVDPMAANVRHPLMVLYASPTYEVWEAVFGAVRVFALANGLLILLTGLLVPILVRRSMNPLRELAVAAGGVTVGSWKFAPGEDVRQVAELRPLVEAMEGVIGRLELSFTQQRQFVGDAAHELKTAVAVVKSSIQLLELRARTTQEYAEGLARCSADCLRVEELTQKMLLMARVEERDVAAPTERTDLAKGINDAVQELASVAALHRVGLNLEGAVSVTVRMSADLLRSLLINLLTNAVQHSKAESAVRLGVTLSGGGVVMVIDDTGEGIEAAALPFVFDRFYRGDPSRSRETGGTGLGLAICKAIVERAGGNIGIESVVGTGTRVIVRLPVIF